MNPLATWGPLADRLRNSEMFEAINSIDWANLWHSHGSAKDVPLHLNALVGASDEERRDALEYFWEYMLHQGSRYEASPYTVRFLFEVLEQPDCQAPRELIDLVLALGVGYGESFLPAGYDLEKEELRFKTGRSGGLYDYEDARSAYKEVHDRAMSFTRFVRPEYSSEIRHSAAFAIAHFAQRLSPFHEELVEYIRSETDRVQLESLILSYGMLGRYAKVKPPQHSLLPYLDVSNSKTMRVVSAIAITTTYGPDAPLDAIQILIRALNEAWQLESYREGWQWWNEGDLLGYAGRVLLLVGTQHREVIARAFCAALDELKICTFAIPNALLDLLFPEPTPSDGRNVEEFDDLQRRSLQILLRSNHWRDWQISQRFLPRGLTGESYRTALQRFQHAILGSDPSPKTTRFAKSGNVSSWNLQKDWPPSVLEALAGKDESSTGSFDTAYGSLAADPLTIPKDPSPLPEGLG